MFTVLKGILIIAAIYGGIVLFLYYGIKFKEKWQENRDRTKNFQNREILKVLLELDDATLGESMFLYREKFGAGAARYARKTYQKWKTGKVSPNRQTFECFLIHLPKIMNFDLKCTVLRHLMEEYAANDAQEEMRNLINNAELLDKSVADYKISTTFETASGTTNVEIRKNSTLSPNLLIAIFAGLIVIGLITYFLLKN